MHYSNIYRLVVQRTALASKGNTKLWKKVHALHSML